MYTYIQEGVATSLGLTPMGPVPITATTRLVYEGYMYRIRLVFPETATTRLVYEGYMYRIRLVFPEGGAVEVNAVEVPYMIRPSKRIKCMIGRDILQLCTLTYDGRANAATLDLQVGS